MYVRYVYIFLHVPAGRVGMYLCSFSPLQDLIRILLIFNSSELASSSFLAMRCVFEKFFQSLCVPLELPLDVVVVTSNVF